MAKTLNLVLLLAIAFMTRSAEAQLPDCYFQEVNLVPCLTSGAAGNTSEVCCQALNQALSTGQHCLCSILSSTNLFLDTINPIPTSPRGIELPGCDLFMPSLSACQGYTSYV
jgi:Probable lipid transfer